MKTAVMKYGFISGAIVSLSLIAMGIIGVDEIMTSNWGMVIGFGSMIIAFAFIFVALKKYRDKHEGRLSFGRALSIGLLVTLIASTCYVATWFVELKYFYPDFMETYTACLIEKEKASGASGKELAEKVAEIEDYKQAYKTNAGVISYTYMEILMVGIPVSLIAALSMMRRKPRQFAQPE